MKNIHNVIKIIFFIFVITVAIVATGTYFLKRNKSAGQPTLTANFIDLDTVEKISKYRSC